MSPEADSGPSIEVAAFSEEGKSPQVPGPLIRVPVGAIISTIGREVGYDSEAAFSRAFKKATGLAPGAWREVRRAARS